MKKLISLILVIVMFVSFTACDNGESKKIEEDAATDEVSTIVEENTITEESISEETTIDVMTKEEMIQSAVEIGNYQKEMRENIARAEAKYVGNIYYITGSVNNINSDYLNIGNFTVYLPVEDIIKVSTKQKITVVGKIDSIALEEQNGFGYTSTICTGVMSNAYLVTDVYELTGVLTFDYLWLRDVDGTLYSRDGNPDAWRIGLDITEENNDSVFYNMEESIHVKHVAGQRIATVTFGGQELSKGSKITVSGKIFYDGNDYLLKEAELISVN